jgi:hypothetical protein
MLCGQMQPWLLTFAALTGFGAHTFVLCGAGCSVFRNCRYQPFRSQPASMQ